MDGCTDNKNVFGNESKLCGDIKRSITFNFKYAFLILPVFRSNKNVVSYISLNEVVKKLNSDLEGMSLDDHGDVTVEALQPLLVQTLQDIVAKVRDRHLQRLSHNALPSTTGSAGSRNKLVCG